MGNDWKLLEMIGNDWKLMKMIWKGGENKALKSNAKL
ncbi:hypothetical protein H500_01540 [Helicobacter pylori CG-IMSS-2012]|nr:hypothetical protein H500_01540 [Helicobacter pylori CG-IMSS-2012]